MSLNTMKPSKVSDRLAQALCVLEHGPVACISKNEYSRPLIAAYQMLAPFVIRNGNSPIDFEWKGSQYNLFCGGGQCTLSQIIPEPQKSLGQEIAEALLGIATLGMAGCSSVPEFANAKFIPSYQDATEGEVTQQETAGGPAETEISEDVDGGPIGLSSTCMDSDGDAPATPGKVTIGTADETKRETLDKCKDDKTLIEMLCNENNLSSKEVDCAQVVPDGVCQESEQGAYCKSADDDGDNIPNSKDNCAKINNLDQKDTDKDGVGDACDNCKNITNSSQKDSNLNGKGDACEPLKVFAGGNTTGVIMADGSVWVWGYGKKLMGTENNLHVPVLVNNLKPSTSLVLSLYTACSLSTEGTVQCWGNMKGFGLGEKTSVPIDTGKEKILMLSGDEVTVSGAWCAALTNGAVQCWGSLSTVNGTVVDSPTTIAGLTNVVQLNVGYSGSSAITNKGAIYYWLHGAPEIQGALWMKPQLVKDLPLAKAVTNNIGHACIIDMNDSLWCGSGVFTDPTKVAGLPPVKMFSSGPHHMCALTQGAKVYCWGCETASSAYCAGSMKIVKVPQQAENVENAIWVDVGNSHACAVTKDAKVVCWGSNKQWQLGGADEFELGPIVTEF